MAKKELDYDTITAAVNGDKKAVEVVLEYYSDYIDSLSEGDEDIRQALALKLLETIPEFKKEMEKMQKDKVN